MKYLIPEKTSLLKITKNIDNNTTKTNLKTPLNSNNKYTDINPYKRSFFPYEYSIE